MSWETILGLFGGGFGVFLLKLFADWHQAKRGDRQDAVGAWQQIADRESARLGRLEARVALLEKIVLERDMYIRQLERVIIEADLQLPIRDNDCIRKFE